MVSTDPCTGVPPEWFGWLLINYAASDVALFGAKPEFCTINLLGPRPTDPTVFQDIMAQTCEAADELNIAIVRGHTGMYDSLKDMLGVCTVYGTIEPEKLITPGNAKARRLDSMHKTRRPRNPHQLRLNPQQNGNRSFLAHKNSKNSQNWFVCRVA